MKSLMPVWQCPKCRKKYRQKFGERELKRYCAYCGTRLEISAKYQ